jgi:RNA polymerase sigma-70 factor (ECF subfamily)
VNEDPFIAHRGLLFTVAYEMLGSATDAEDVLQESWLRWWEVQASDIREPRAYAVRIVTRMSLNRLRSLARSREEYVGAWLPEPIATAPDVIDDVELAESVSIAMLTVLETLEPTQRAVFVLREVFRLPFAEIADATGIAPSTVRQIAHRAREHVNSRRPRLTVTAEEHKAVVDRFVVVLDTGRLQDLMDILAPDVVLIADGGGVAAAVLEPVNGANRVARLLARIAKATIDPIVLNGLPAVRIDRGGDTTAMSVHVAGGRVDRVYLIRNPGKLGSLDELRALSRSASPRAVNDG